MKKNIFNKVLPMIPLSQERRSFMKKSAAVSALALGGGVLAPRQVRAQTSNPLLASSIGYTGERRDPVTGCYHLGNGYRMYNPRIMRFHSADSVSPFGRGGINSYAYCLGDPVNRTDPSGHFALLSIITGAIVGAVVGATISAAAEGIRSATSGQSFDWKQVGIGAALGLISGGFGTAAKGATTGVKVGLAIADSITSSATEFGLNVATGMPTKQAGISAGVGAIVGLGSYGVGQGTTRFRRSTQRRLPMRSNTKHPMSIEGQGAYGPWPRGYTDNFRDTGEEAILLHGDPDGKVYVGERAYKDPVTNKWETDYSNLTALTGSQLAQHMKNNEGIDLYKGLPTSPVHLLSCYGKLGAAQDLATEIGRPVIAYSKQPTWTHNLDTIESPAFSVGASFGKWDPRGCFWDRHGAKPRRFTP
ncbi:RHS repeat-associated core domain-containing protein [Vibrio sp. MMG022]|uniref:RHS repeat-associated core domain-containing protein n=1 Tax=Vibrio sp. MMG023 TaxID=2909979 RepID=UPI001F3B3D94|nr:RHS repeat-associated core domain-containing protein [Vibrio sp. MMG023]MCF6452199.1 RHS repeat-associated core domain-containing protein [Vibrio sp. MMG023]